MSRPSSIATNITGARCVRRVCVSVTSTRVGATVLPASAARAVADSIQACMRRIVSPSIEVPLALCTSDRLPLSEPAQAVRAIVLELVDSLEPP